MAENKILCVVPTKDRYDCLYHTLISIANQTRKPDHLLIVDDSGEKLDFRNDPLGGYVCSLLNYKGISWQVLFNPSRGQHVAHQIANTWGQGFNLVWRIDDDCVAEPDVLERLEKAMLPNVGAWGGAVCDLNGFSIHKSGAIEDMFAGNVQWAPDHGVFPVDHLYSSFLYRAGIVNYAYNMTPVGFREETIFSYRLKRAGWYLGADTSIKTYHFRSSHGGTRGDHLEWAYKLDDERFLKLMAEEWGLKVIHLGCGFGDCLAFQNVLPKIIERYNKVLLSTAYPDAFEGFVKDGKVHLIPHNPNGVSDIYAWMNEHRWTQSIVKAFEEMLLP